MLHPVITTSIAVALVAIVLTSSGGAQSPLTLDCRYSSTLDTTTLKKVGAFEEHVTMNQKGVNTKGSLIHYGQCTAAQRQF